MKKEVKTPLAVVYVDEKFHLSMSENLDLSRASSVWGVFFYSDIGKINIFISRENGPDITLNEADKWGYDQYKSYFFDEHDVILYGGLPHYEEILLLMLGEIDDVNKTMQIFRKHGISADDFYDSAYIVYSDEVFESVYDLHIRNIMAHRKLNAPFMYKAMRTDDGGDSLLCFNKDNLPTSKRFHTRVFLHQFS